jgi:hypothetical protein
VKKIILLLLTICAIGTRAQNACVYDVNVSDSTGNYKSTKDFIIYERIFGNSESYILLSLINSEGTPLLNLKTIQKSSEFISANCMDAVTKIIFQLRDGKIVTMLHNNEESCGTFSQNPDDKKNVRFNSGIFLFIKGSIEELKASPITLMRIQFSTGKMDYVLNKELKSEFTKKTEFPEQFFIDNLKCVE